MWLGGKAWGSGSLGGSGGGVVLSSEGAGKMFVCWGTRELGLCVGYWAVVGGLWAGVTLGRGDVVQGTVHLWFPLFPLTFPH